jgi:hypothetical protein
MDFVRLSVGDSAVHPWGKISSGLDFITTSERLSQSESSLVTAAMTSH